MSLEPWAQDDDFLNAAVTPELLTNHKQQQNDEGIIFALPDNNPESRPISHRKNHTMHPQKKFSTVDFVKKNQE